MSPDTETHKAQAREQSEPFERVNPVPKAVLALIAALLLWAVSYILVFSPKDGPELGDRRTLAALGGAAPAAAGAKIDGAQVFASQCVACHQATGMGIPGAFPPLAGSEWVNGSSKVLAKILLHGIEGNLTVADKPYAGQMPAFKDKLSDAEIAAVASHIRTQWGNNAPPLDSALVADARKTTDDRTGPWKGDTELSALPKD